MQRAPDIPEVPAADWQIELLSATRLLALGSLLLIPAALLVSASYANLRFAGLFGYILVAGTAIGLHLLAWIRLYRASCASLPLTLAFWGSVGGFIAGLSAFSFLIARGFSMWSPLLGLIFICTPYGLFLPLYPVVFAPVVLGHVAFFLVARTSLRDPRAADAGCVYLAAVAIGALVAQFAAGASMVVLFLSGATFAGYALVASAWRRELVPVRPRHDRNPAPGLQPPHDADEPPELASG